MSPNEKYPWSLLTEVGDYFCVPTEVKPYQYMSQLVVQRNYRFPDMRLTTERVSYGTIVMLAQIEAEIPPHEFISPDGILSSTSRRHLIGARANPPEHNLGEKPISPKRTQQQIINAMHWEVRNANLPWWYDPKKGQLVVNPDVVKNPEAELFYKNQFNPGPETPYPDHYNLDENLIRRTEVADDEEDDEQWGDQTFEPSTGETDSE